MLFETLAVNSEIQLKAAKPSYAPALWRLVQENRPHLEKWMDWAQNLKNIANTERYLREMNLFNQGQQHFFSFIFSEEQLVGSIALLKRDKINHSAEIAFWKHPVLLSKDDMFLTCTSLIEYIWTYDFIQRLELQTLSLNEPAKNLAARLGFELEGRKRRAIFRNRGYLDLDVYGLLKQESLDNK